MKTTIMHNNQTNTRTTRIIFAIILVIILISTGRTFAGDGLTGIRIQSNMTGSGLSANICLAAVFKLGNGSIGIGPDLQARKFNLSGFQCTYRYSVEKNNGAKAHLFFFSNAIYNRKAYLSRSSCNWESVVSKDQNANFTKMKLSTIEMYGGFGLKLNHSKRISSSWGIGMGFYKTLGEQDTCRKMYRDRNGVGLSINCSLAYTFEKNK